MFDYILSTIYVRQYKKIYNQHKDILNKKFHKAELKAYKTYWRSIGKANSIYYKLFSQMGGVGYDNVPEDLLHNVIENILNPPQYRGYFSDKNMYDRILGNDIMPKTYLRRIQGVYYDSEYSLLNLSEKNIEELLPENFIAKKTVDTSSGIGVRLFRRDGNCWKEVQSQEKFSLHYLNQSLGEDYIIQEWMTQSKFMSSLCRSSINKLRLLVYRSVEDNQVRLLNSVIRIGNEGSYMDNAHQGGVFAGIDTDGNIHAKVCNQYGDFSDCHNGINFKERHLQIPNWENVCKFACSVGEKIPYHRCVNLDVMLDADNNPKLIEFNIRAMGVWVFQFVNGPAFGKYTPEIINYCALNKQKIRSEYLYY